LARLGTANIPPAAGACEAMLGRQAAWPDLAQRTFHRTPAPATTARTADPLEGWKEVAGGTGRGGMCGACAPPILGGPERDRPGGLSYLLAPHRAPKPNIGGQGRDRGEKLRLRFAVCSQFIRLGGFFMKFRGRKAHPNRVEKPLAHRGIPRAATGAFHEISRAEGCGQEAGRPVLLAGGRGLTTIAARNVSRSLEIG
jgi:hypothetical protein